MDGQTKTQPGAADIEAALARILGSETFSRATRARRFLEFVVSETLAGRGDRLKGYAIGIEVFDRGDGFDAHSDPLVRVEAGRLRRRLLEYYAGPGAADPVRIEIARGNYTPGFRWSSCGVAGTATVRQSRRPAAIAALLAVVVAGTWFLIRSPSTNEMSEGRPAASVATADFVAVRAATPPLPRVVVLPVEALSAGAEMRGISAGLTEELNVALAAFNIVATAAAPREMLNEITLRELRETFDAGFVLTGSVRRDASKARFLFRLIETGSGTQLWTEAFEYRLESQELAPVEKALGLRIAMLLSSPYGPAYGHEIAQIRHLQAIELDPYQCLLRFYGYARSFDRQDHAASVECMQRAVLGAPEFATAWAALGTLYLHEFTFGYTPQPDRAPPLDRALEAVRRSLDIDGSGRVAAITLPSILLAAGDREGFLRAADRALAIRPNHPAVRAQIGYTLTLTGDWQRGLPLIEAAIPVTADAPGWYYGAYALRYLDVGDFDAALEWALKIDSPGWFMEPVLVAATAALAGRQELAERQIDRLHTLFPEFRHEGRERLSAMAMNAPMREQLATGLALAGLELD